ncbi:MAG: DUF4491 family protein [Chloroflexi bacterium]|nr:DUF4491 family protein [Chloroflexota bacterium]
MNWFGLILGITTLFVIGLGFFWVIRGERYFGLHWWPYLILMGITIILGSLFIPSNWGSGFMGIVGASILWGATEFKEQAVRTELGWYPFHEEKIQPPFVEIIKKWRPPHL